MNRLIALTLVVALPCTALAQQAERPLTPGYEQALPRSLLDAPSAVPAPLYASWRFWFGLGAASAVTVAAGVVLYALRGLLFDKRQPLADSPCGAGCDGSINRPPL